MSLARPIPIPGGGSSAFTGLSDTPSSYAGQSRRRIRVKKDETGLEFFKAESLWVTEFDAAGVKTTTTLTAQLDAGSSVMQVADASSFSKGQGVCIPGAGVGGAELAVVITDYISGNSITFAPATSTTVVIGTTIHHDDTVAIKNALLEAENIFLPDGNYNVLGGGQTSILLNSLAQCMRGNGNSFRTLLARTILWSRSLEQDVVRLYAENSILMDLAIGMESTITPISGAGVVLGQIDMSGVLGATCPYHARVENVGVRNLYDGFRTEFSVGCWIDRVYVVSPRRHGFYFNEPAPTGGNSYQRMQAHMRGDAPWKATAGAGFYFENCDSTRFHKIAITGFKTNLHYNANNTMPGYSWGGGQPGCFQHTWTNFFIEIPGDITQPVIKFEGTERIERIKFTGSEIGGGIFIGGDQTVDVGFTGFTMPTFGCSGFEIRAKGTTLANGDISGSGEAYGIKIGTEAEGTQIVNVTPRGFLKGLIVECGATGTQIANSNFTYCTTASQLGNNTAEEMAIRNNGRFENNIGLPFYGPSISFTPGWIGQAAFVSGQWYDARGTASASDWKIRAGGGGMDGGWFQDPVNSATTIDGGSFA